jgi:hypothetical protein
MTSGEGWFSNNGIRSRGLKPLHAVITGLVPVISLGRVSAPLIGMAGSSASEATPFFERLCPAMTKREDLSNSRHHSRGGIRPSFALNVASSNE